MALKGLQKYAMVKNMRFMYGERVFQQPVGIPMGTNYAHLVASLFLHSYTDYFLPSLLRKS